MEIGKIIVLHGQLSLQTGDKIAYALRDGRLTADEIDQIMEKVADKDVIVKVDKDLFEKELDDVAEGKESDDIVG